jgi:uncharacterized protein
MDQQVNFITVATPDLDAVRRCYLDGLGWRATMDVPGEVVFIQAGPGLMLSFFASASFVADVGVGERVGTAPSGVTVSHNVGSPDEVDRVIAEFVAAGASVLKQPQHAEWGGYHGHVADPTGLIWEIAHNPGWRVEPDGTVVMG